MTMEVYKEDEFNLPSQRLDQTRSVTIDESLERLSWLMDDLIRVPGLGWRFGLDAIVGLIPGFGDAATSLVSFYILVAAVRYRVPRVTLLRMGLNIGIEKSNQMNLDLMRKRATISAGETRKGTLSDWLFVGLIILLLAGLAIGAAAVSFALLLLIANQFSKALSA